MALTDFLEPLLASEPPPGESDVYVPDTLLEPDMAVPDLGDADGILAAAQLLAGETPAHMTETIPDTLQQVAAFPLTAAALPPFNGRTLRFIPRPHRMAGRDVLAVERTLKQMHLREQDPSLFFGRYARHQVSAFQHRVGLTADGQYGSRTHVQLRPHMDAYSRWLYLNQVAPAVKVRTPAERFAHALWYLYAKRPWVYHPVRPFRLYRYGQAVTYAYDCSWFVTQAAFLAGLPDPNGYGYQGGVGNTETLRVHGTPVGVGGIGCLVFYGYYGSRTDPAHVAACLPGQQCMGFGSTGGPRVLPINYRPIRQIRRYF